MRGYAAAVALLSAVSLGADEPQGFVVDVRADGQYECRHASSAETSKMRVPADIELARVRRTGGVTLSSGLNIDLHATPTLQANQAAMAAFGRAAAAWEAKIATPVTIAVRVDFGPTRFGQPFEDGNLGSASSLGLTLPYSLLRQSLHGQADSDERDLLSALPTVLQTDVGAASNVWVTSSIAQVLGFQAPQLDQTPTIGFNSAYGFDFDASDGIAPNLYDFEAVATHEIGHALGFGSGVGNVELGYSLAPTVHDLFRFRPSVTTTTFGTSLRVQASGGEQVFFAGGDRIPLSTGRADKTGGDGQQASHWKDNLGIGLMDPTGAPGVRGVLTANDLAAFDAIGYTIAASGTTCDAEPNETVTDASPLTLSQPCSGIVTSTDAATITITYNDGTIDKVEDIFRLTLPTSARLSVNLAFTSGDLDLFLFAASGSTLNVLGASNGTTSIEAFTTDPLAAGTYYVGVSAYSGQSNYTLTASAVGVVQTPAAPSNLTATATSSTQISLAWTDNSNNETGFIVEARSGSSGFAQLGDLVPANVNTVTVNGAVAGVTYAFRVKARNASGDSGYSNEVSATTPGAGQACVTSDTVACLLGGRFRVSIAYINAFVNPPQPGNFRGAKLVQGNQNPDVATFGISSPQAIEVVVRIQDTRIFGLNRFDVYYGGLTDLEYTVTVTDTQRNVTRMYRNAPGVVGGGVDRTSFVAN